MCANLAWYVKDSYYIMLCFNSQNLFGCTGMKKHQFCILNKQYSESDYHRLVQKVIRHMVRNRRVGGSFSQSRSLPLPIMNLLRMNGIRLSRELALDFGYTWKERDPREFKEQTYQVPEKIVDVSDEITKEVLACAKCEKNFRITAQELGFYKR